MNISAAQVRTVDGWNINNKLKINMNMKLQMTDCSLLTRMLATVPCGAQLTIVVVVVVAIVVVVVVGVFMRGY
jgi:hypothetical protein